MGFADIRGLLVRFVCPWIILRERINGLYVGLTTWFM